MPTKDATLTKETVIEMIRDLPDDEAAADTLEAIYIRMKIDEGIRQADNGEVIDHEEFKRRMSKWLT
jgi:predicted transcriptional regulator